MRYHLAADLREAADAIGDPEEAVRVDQSPRSPVGVPAVAEHGGGGSGRFRYPTITCGPLIAMTPRSPSGRSMACLGVRRLDGRTRQGKSDGTRQLLPSIVATAAAAEPPRGTLTATTGDSSVHP